MFNKKYLLVLTFFLLVSTFGCEYEGDVIFNDLVGVWHSSYADSYEIKENKEFVYYAKDGEVAFQGVIVNEDLYELANSSGEMVIRLTEDGSIVHFDEYGGYDMDYTYMVDNYYTIIPYKENTGSTIQFSSPYKDGESESRASKNEAISELTEENGYFGLYGDYTKE